MSSLDERQSDPASSGTARWEKKARRLSDRNVRISLAVAGVTLIVILVFLQVSAFNENRMVRRQVSQSYERRFLLDRLMSLHQDIETSQRGFTIAGKPEFLQPYRAARPQIGKVFGQLHQLSSDADDQHHLAQLEKLSREKVAITEAVIRAGLSGDRADARAMVASGRGRRAMDRFRREVDRWRRAEQGEFDVLLRSAADANLRTQASTAAVQLLLLGLIAAAFLAYATNLRRLHRVTAAARDTSKRQVAIFEAAGDAMVVVDDRGRIETLNPAARRLFGLKEGQALGQNVQGLFEGGTVYIAGYNDRRSDQREEQAMTHLQGLRTDGNSFEAEIATSAVQLAGGVRTLLLIRDATDRNRVERMKNEFVATVSHELRTPLTSIRGSLALIDHDLSTTLEERPRQLLTMASQNAERLSMLIDDILDIEKLGSGAIELVLMPTDLNDTLEEACEQNRPYAERLGVSLDLQRSKSPLVAIVDPGRIQQVMTNLISNAAKFSPEGETVTLAAEALDGWARISVRDRGPGIPPSFRSQLFQRFAQADRSKPRGQSGTGLGLAIAKAIIEMHRGSIGFDSAAGQGTCFWFQLPLEGYS